MKWLSKLFKGGQSIRRISTEDEQCRASKECLRFCRSCGLPISTDAMSRIETQNSSLIYHPECLRCHACGRPFTKPQKLALVGEGTWVETYHRSCLSYKCVVCHKSFSPNEDARIEMFWVPLNTNYTLLRDGRSICSECLELAIMDIDDCQQLYRSIRGFFEGLNMRIPQKTIPVSLVDISTLKEAIKGDKHDLHLIPDHLGLCTSRVDIHNGTCVVLAIRVLYGLPSGYQDISVEVEEGMCQVLAHMWLESQVLPETTSMPSTTPSSSSPWSSSFENKLHKNIMYRTVHNKSPIYGGGYRDAMSAVKKYGLHHTLDHIRHTGTLPKVVL
ncbi:hypothetical protein OROGR_015579 [Orobanche gracilis]